MSVKEIFAIFDLLETELRGGGGVNQSTEPYKKFEDMMNEIRSYVERVKRESIKEVERSNVERVKREERDEKRSNVERVERESLKELEMKEAKEEKKEKNKLESEMRKEKEIIKKEEGIIY
jgi:hypothetical protein